MGRRYHNQFLILDIRKPNEGHGLVLAVVVVLVATIRKTGGSGCRVALTPLWSCHFRVSSCNRRLLVSNLTVNYMVQVNDPYVQ